MRAHDFKLGALRIDHPYTLPAGAELRLRHGGEFHLMLIDLRAPLRVGERFPMTLRFENAGEREVMVWVQPPREPADAHKH